MNNRRNKQIGVFCPKDFVEVSVVALLTILVLDGACLFAECSEKTCEGLTGCARRDTAVAVAVAGTAGMDGKAAAALKVTPAYIPLPPGAVRPKSWLLDWAEAARDGLTGHLDERATAFRKSWSGEHFEAKGVREQGTGEPIEPCAYWLDGMVRLGYALQDDYLISKTKSRLDVVVQGVLDGGPSQCHPPGT